MEIFEEEIIAGIGDKVAKANSIFIESQATVFADALPNISVASNELGDDFLFFLKSILVTVGMNKNDDYFDKDEVWRARNTPEDKPYNFSHQQDQVIGHITSVVPVDEKGEEIKEIRDSYSLYVTGCLYKYCREEKRQELIDTLLAEIVEGKWYVSMECFFKGFDYVMVDAAGKPEIVKRNASTAYLTKHLRAYGGSGTWGGKRLGRVLRDILFIGNGIVSDPAKPKSLIYDMNNTPLSKASTNMNEKEIEALRASLKDGEVKLADAMKLVETTKAAEATAKTKSEGLEAKVKELEVKLTEQTNLLTISEAAVKAADVKIAELTSANEAFAKSISEYTKASRIDNIKSVYQVDEAEASKIYDSVKSLDNQQFATLLDTQKKYLVKARAQTPAEVLASAKPVETEKVTVSVAGLNKTVVDDVHDYFKNLIGDK